MNTEARVTRILKKLDKQRENVRMLEYDKRSVEERVSKYKNDIKDKQHKIDVYTKAAMVFKQEADQRNEEAKEALENVLNYALSNIQLEQEYEAYIQEVANKRSGKEMNVVLRDINTGRERVLKTQTGTAIRQIVSFLMTVIVIKFSGASKWMLVDEKFSGLQDQETIRMFGDILVALANNEGFQFILVEHKSELKRVEGMTVIPLELSDYERGLQVVGI